MSSPDLIVVGGGAIGSSIAFYASASGAKVTLLERRQFGGHASYASAGLLHPIDSIDAPAYLRAFSEVSFAQFPGLAQQLREISSLDIGYQECGWMRVALTEAEADDLRARMHAAPRHGIAAEWLSPADAWELEPALSPALVAALRLPAGAQLYAPAFVRALHLAATRQGTDIRHGVEVAGLSTSGHTVRGVRLATGDIIEAGHTVIAGGAWSRILVEDLGISLPVAPIRGQILSLESATPALRHVIFGSDVYLAPKQDGSSVVGATYEDVGYDDRLTAEGVAFLLLHGQRLAPQLAKATFRKAWTGLRPGSPDGMPILGVAGDWQQLSLATGHTAEGILLAPITGQLLSRLALYGELDESLIPYTLDRFST